LEGTLIDDALSARPRAGLAEFLAFCHDRFERVAVFTSVEEADARGVLEELARRGYVPPGLLARLEYIGWAGEHKDLAFVPGVTPGEVLLVDDDAGWVRPDQRERWIDVTAWGGGPDAELARAQSVLERWMADPDAQEGFGRVAT
jgi:hypothetical protein